MNRTSGGAGVRGSRVPGNQTHTAETRKGQGRGQPEPSQRLVWGWGKEEGSPCRGHHVGPRDPRPLGNQRPQQAGRASPGQRRKAPRDRTPLPLPQFALLSNRGQKQHRVQRHWAGGHRWPSEFLSQAGAGCRQVQPLPRAPNQLCHQALATWRTVRKRLL